MFTALRYEWRLMSAEPGFRLLAVLVVALSIAGLAYGHRWSLGLDVKLEKSRADEDKRLAAYKKKILDIESKKDPKLEIPAADWSGHPLLASSFALTTGSRTAGLPTRSLTMLAVGQSDILPWVAGVTLRQRGDLFESQGFSSDEIANPDHLLAGHFDYAFVCVFLLPLLIIGWTHAFLSGEKESGRWGLLLAQSGQARALLLRRLVCRWAVFCLLACGALFSAAAYSGAWRSPGTLIFAAVLVSFYCAFWFALAFWINTRGGGSAFNAVALASAWLLVVLVLPQVSAVIADTATPAPSRIGLRHSLRDISNALAAKGDAALDVYYLEHPEMLRRSQVPDFKVYYNTNYAIQRITDVALSAEVEKFEARLKRREKAMTILNFLSPAVILQESLCEIAGTHPSRHALFKEQVLAYHDRMRERLEPLVFSQSLMTVPDVEAVPAFSFVDGASVGSRLRIWPALIFLSVAASLLVCAGAIRLGRT